jgi:serine/threonine protein kinase
MKFQCVLCKSAYSATQVELGDSKACPNCGKRIVVPRKNYDSGRLIGGDFVIEKTVGAGGMGTVFLARQVSLDRSIALKVLLRRFSIDDKFRKEFLREAQSVASMIHGNLVQVYAFGVEESDLYLAMEYVEGETLGDRLEKHERMSVDEALNVIQQMAEGLHYAWEKARLIHRDIKPDNIMLSKEGWAKLTDMGLARQQRDLQDVQEVSGTPAYMNPEQFLKSPMDCRADIYSLGIVLYHSVTGRLPFESDSVSELARQHIQDPVVFDTKKLDLPMEVRRLIKKMLEKDVDNRHADYDALLTEIIKVRQDLSKAPEAVPGIHTISFNRKDFVNFKLDMARESKNTDMLPRRKIESLNKTSTEFFTESETMGFQKSKSGTGAVLWTNLVAIAAVVVALIAALFSSPPKTVYEMEAENLMQRISGSELDAERGLTDIQRVLDQFPLQGNVREMALRAELLDIKSQLLLEDISTFHREKDSLNERVASVLKEKAVLSNEKRQIEKELNLKYDELLNSIKGLKNVEAEAQTDKEALDQTPNLVVENLLASDAMVLDRLWDEKLGRITMNVFREVFYWNSDVAQELLNVEKLALSGVYLKEVSLLDELVQNAGQFQERFREALKLLPGTYIYFGEGEEEIEELITAVSEKTLELKGESGKIYKVSEMDLAQQFLIFENVVSKSKMDNEQFFSHAICSLNFNEASKWTETNEKLENVWSIYVKNRLATIVFYKARGLDANALELAKKLQLASENFESNKKPVDDEIIKVLGEEWKNEE